MRSPRHCPAVIRSGWPWPRARRLRRAWWPRQGPEAFSRWARPWAAWPLGSWRCGSSWRWRTARSSCLRPGLSNHRKSSPTGRSRSSITWGTIRPAKNAHRVLRSSPSTSIAPASTHRLPISGIVPETSNGCCLPCWANRRRRRLCRCVRTRLTCGWTARGDCWSSRPLPTGCRPAVKSSRAVDWSRIFELAGLRIEDFQSVPPVRQPPMYADHLAAWEARPEGRKPGVVARGATLAGRVVFFQAGPAAEEVETARRGDVGLRCGALLSGDWS